MLRHFGMNDICMNALRLLQIGLLLLLLLLLLFFNWFILCIAKL